MIVMSKISSYQLVLKIIFCLSEIYNCKPICLYKILLLKLLLKWSFEKNGVDLLRKPTNDLN